jgi:hypothetical protein
LAIAALGWFIFGDTARPRTIRSRLTIVVETPEGDRTGSSVTQITTRFPGGLARADGYSIWTSLVGDAVVVDLGSRGLLFATFETESGLARGGWDEYNGVFTSFPREKLRGARWKDMSSTDEYAAYLDELIHLRPKGDLPSNSMPVLVRFRDPTNSASVELVDPLDLAASFGPGVKLKSAFVEITDDPITRGMDAKLPWLASSKVSPSLFPPDDPKINHRYMNDTPPVAHLRYDAFRRIPNWRRSRFVTPDRAAKVPYYEGRYHDFQLPLPMRLVWAVPYSRPKAPAGDVKANYPGFIEPVLASSIEKVPAGERWIHEIKFDG